jgi:hypothetical protein
MTIGEKQLMCPFCRTKLSAFPPQLCSGSFLDDAHPANVSPVTIVLDVDGEPTPESEARLAAARDAAQYADPPR